MAANAILSSLALGKGATKVVFREISNFCNSLKNIVTWTGKFRHFASKTYCDDMNSYRH